MTTELDGVLRNRHNKTARGMTRTLYRGQRGRHSDICNTLSVRGTLDSLSGWRMYFYSTRQQCPCCGSRSAGKLVLNERGKRRLELIRRLRNR